MLPLGVFLIAPRADLAACFGGDVIVHAYHVGATRAPIGLWPIFGPFTRASSAVLKDSNGVLVATRTTLDSEGVVTTGGDFVRAGLGLDCFGVGDFGHLIPSCKFHYLLDYDTIIADFAIKSIIFIADFAYFKVKSLRFIAILAIIVASFKEVGVPVYVRLKAYLDDLKAIEMSKPPSQRKKVPSLSELARKLGLHQTHLARIAGNKMASLNFKIFGDIITEMRGRGFPMQVTDLLVYRDPDETDCQD